MLWRIDHPLLFCLPAGICFCLHILISAALVTDSKDRVYRWFIYLAGSLFMLVYLLLLNHSLTLATTKVWVNIPGNFIALKNQYGLVQIPKEAVLALVVEGPAANPRIIWVISENQVFYLDQNFRELPAFLKTVSRLVPLASPQLLEEKTIYRALHANSENLDLSGKKNRLKGQNFWYLPLSGIVFYRPPSWFLAGFIILYLFYLLFLSAMCSRDTKGA